MRGGYSEAVNFLKLSLLVASLGALVMGDVAIWALCIALVGAVAFYSDFTKSPDKHSLEPQHPRVPYVSTLSGHSFAGSDNGIAFT